MCNCSNRNQQKKVKFPLLFPSLFPFRRAWNFFLVFFTRSMKVLRDFFSNPFFYRLFNPSSSMCAVERLIWKCAFAHWNHVVLPAFSIRLLGLAALVILPTRSSALLQLLEFIKPFGLLRSLPTPFNPSTFPFSINLTTAQMLSFPTSFSFLFDGWAAKKGADAT